MILVIGGSGSGKSAYAEALAMTLSQGGNRRNYYLATMEVLEKEGQEKVDRHRHMRDGKGFLTIEQPVSIEKALEKIETGETIGLLECISNLAANEMFSGKAGRLEEGKLSKEQVVEKIVKGIGKLQKELTHLIVVSSNVFEDGNSYDKATMDYIQAMGKIHEKLGAMADQVTEVVVGIPVRIK